MRLDVVNEWTASFSTCRVSGFRSNASPVFFVESSTVSLHRNRQGDTFKHRLTRTSDTNRLKDLQLHNSTSCAVTFRA